MGLFISCDLKTKKKQKRMNGREENEIVSIQEYKEIRQRIGN